MSAVIVTEPDDDLVVEPLEPFEPTETVYGSSELPPAPDDPFAVFVCTLADACLAAGELAVAGLLPSLLFSGQLAEGKGDDLALAELVERGWLMPDEGGYRMREQLMAEAAGWRAILRGTSDDLAPCGPLPLDEWAAHLAAGLCAKPEKEPVFRRELRSRGVAAFGLVEAAA
jgi:hypothetical protein